MQKNPETDRTNQARGFLQLFSEVMEKCITEPHTVEDVAIGIDSHDPQGVPIVRIDYLIESTDKDALHAAHAVVRALVPETSITRPNLGSMLLYTCGTESSHGSRVMRCRREIKDPQEISFLLPLSEIKAKQEILEAIKFSLDRDSKKLPKMMAAVDEMKNYEGAGNIGIDIAFTPSRFSTEAGMMPEIHIQTDSEAFVAAVNKTNQEDKRNIVCERKLATACWKDGSGRTHTGGFDLYVRNGAGIGIVQDSLETLGAEHGKSR